MYVTPFVMPVIYSTEQLKLLRSNCVYVGNLLLVFGLSFLLYLHRTLLNAQIILRVSKEIIFIFRTPSYYTIFPRVFKFQSMLNFFQILSPTRVYKKKISSIESNRASRAYSKLSQKYSCRVENVRIVSSIEVLTSTT